jgi:hypothetical protein
MKKITKEYLKLVGVKWYVIWITWLIRILIPYIILSVLMTAATSVQMGPRINNGNNTTKALFKYTSPIVVFSIFFVYSVQTAVFTLLLGQIFSRSKLFIFLLQRNHGIYNFCFFFFLKMNE